MNNTSEILRCHKNGYLVGTEITLPDDLTIYYASKDQPLVGCNRVWCDKCQHFVRSWAGYCLKGRLEGTHLSQEQRKRLYETKNPNGLPFLSTELCSRSRVYACMCHEAEVSGVQIMNIGLWIMDHFDYEYWGCGGHPQK